MQSRTVMSDFEYFELYDSGWPPFGSADLNRARRHPLFPYTVVEPFKDVSFLVLGYKTIPLQ